ncbi:MAG: hypothetical protein PHI01_03545 [Candidatus Izemoplasmatales bacterium]|nr:hypothetical protein [Candidatus Izemoplasmatales bacterium]
MKKILKFALIALVGIAMMTIGVKNMMRNSVTKGVSEVVLVDFENSGEPEWVTR